MLLTNDIVTSEAESMFLPIHSKKATKLRDFWFSKKSRSHTCRGTWSNVSLVFVRLNPIAILCLFSHKQPKHSPADSLSTRRTAWNTHVKYRPLDGRTFGDYGTNKCSFKDFWAWLYGDELWTLYFPGTYRHRMQLKLVWVPPTFIIICKKSPMALCFSQIGICVEEGRADDVDGRADGPWVERMRGRTLERTDAQTRCRIDGRSGERTVRRMEGRPSGFNEVRNPWTITWPRRRPIHLHSTML